MSSDLIVRLAVREFTEHRAPALVSRHHNTSLIVWDPRALRVDITAHLLDILTEDEQRGLMEGLHLGPAPVGSPITPERPLPDWTVAAKPAFLYVPKALRLAGAPAFQGGRTYEERKVRGELSLERYAYRQERLGRAIDLDVIADLTAA